MKKKSIYITDASGLNRVNVYNDIESASFFRVAIHPFLRVIIHATEEQKVDGNRIILTYELVRERNAFHVTQLPPILRLERWNIFAKNIITQHCTTI